MKIPLPSSRHHSQASLTRLNQHSVFEQQGKGSRRMESQATLREMPTNTGVIPQIKVQSAALQDVVPLVACF
jgi:hypothetical protein